MKAPCINLKIAIIIIKNQQYRTLLEQAPMMVIILCCRTIAFDWLAFMCNMALYL
jgi:hypothetical protein